MQDFRLFYNQTVHPELMNLEQRRQRLMRLLFLSGWLVLGVVALQIYLGIFLITLLLLIPVGVWMAYLVFRVKVYFAEFKPRVVESLLDFIDNDVNYTFEGYQPKGLIAKKQFLDSKIFTTAHDYAGEDLLRGSAGRDMVYGEQGKDRLHGDDGDDYLWGGGDDDVLDGGEGHDEVVGGDGDDDVGGAAGDDRLPVGVGRSPAAVDGGNRVEKSAARPPGDVAAVRDGPRRRGALGRSARAVRPVRAAAGRERRRRQEIRVSAGRTRSSGGSASRRA